MRRFLRARRGRDRETIPPEDARGQGPSEGHPPPAGSGGCPERPRLTRKQRDAVYYLIATRTGLLGDLQAAIDDGNFDRAERWGWEVSDSMHLILKDLGWGVEGEAVELTMPAEDLRRVFGLFHERAARSLQSEEKEEAELRAIREESQLVLDACKAVLTTLDMQEMRA